MISPNYRRRGHGWQNAPSPIESHFHAVFSKKIILINQTFTLLCWANPHSENWMITQGYKRYDIYDINQWHCKLSLTYANPLWNKEPPKSGFEYKIKHSGISAIYEPSLQQPAVFGLCIPNGLKTFLQSFDKMDEKLQSFVLSRTKKCNGCKYCVQTDKTHSRPLAYIKVNYEQQEYNLCPYFPGYSYRWTNINDDLADQLIKTLSFLDKFAPNKGEKIYGKNNKRRKV